MARPRSDIRPRLLASARARFLREGVDGASLRSIAKDAETNIGMVYYYFPTKEDLFRAVVDDVYSGILDDVRAVFEDEGRALEDRLRALSVRLGAMSETELEVVRLILREVLASTDRRGWIFERFGEGHVGLIARKLAEAVGQGELRSDLPLPVLLAAVAGLTILPQLLRRIASGHAGFVLALLPTPEVLANGVLEIFLHGASGPSARGARKSR
jgi:AcrR family transcriptional regulator